MVNIALQSPPTQHGLSGAASCSHWLSNHVKDKPPSVYAHIRDKRDAKPAASAPRRVWSMIVFGYELQMLELHMRVLQPVVSGFFVAESTTTFAHVNLMRLAPNKPAVLSEAIANKTFPSDLAAITHVTVLTAKDAKAMCSKSKLGGAAGCYEALQYHLAKQQMLTVAKPGDLALMGDVDEIASPEILSKLVACMPWWGDTGELERGVVSYLDRNLPPHKILFDAWEFKYGVHCYPGEKARTGPSFASAHATWSHGPQLFSVSWLMAMAKPEANMTRVTALRDERLHGIWGRHYAKIEGSAWHLTSFGGVGDLARKLRTWGHADLFNERKNPGVLDRARLERCQRFCLSPLGYLDVMNHHLPKQVQETHARLRSNRTGLLPAPPCDHRFGMREAPLTGSVLHEKDLSDPHVRRHLPAYLLANRQKYADYFQYLES